MTTFAYPITLYRYTFEELENLLKLECEKWENEGVPCYRSDNGRPMGMPASILEIMNEAKKASSENGEAFSSGVTFTLTDYLFIPLENLLKDKCREYKDKTGNDPFNPITGESQCGYASMLEGMKLAIKNMSLNSYSSFVDSEPVKLWSPK
jgi:hypothetical protein